jgi:hypothetical protein
MVEVENRDADWPSPFDCGFLTPYEADFRTSGEVGPVLAAALGAPEADCSE